MRLVCLSWFFSRHPDTLGYWFCHFLLGCFDVIIFTFFGRCISCSIFASSFAINVVSSAYLRLLIILPPMEIPPCKFSVVLRIMIAPYMLNNLGESIQPCRTPLAHLKGLDISFQILMQFSLCSYRFLKGLAVVSKTQNSRWYVEFSFFYQLSAVKYLVSCSSSFDEAGLLNWYFVCPGSSWASDLLVLVGLCWHGR